MKNVLIRTLAMIFIISTTACASKATKFEKLLEKGTGQKFTLVKENTETAGYVVFKNDVTGEYVAYNLNKFDKKHQKTLGDYLAVATGTNDIVHNLGQKSEWVVSGYWKTGEYIETKDTVRTCDSDGHCSTRTITHNDWYAYDQPVWIDTSHTYYWYEGNGMRFSTAQSAIKDLETLGSIVEKMEQSTIQQMLSVKYGLSQDRAEKLARLNSQYKQITSQRELSDDDRDYFSKQSFGVGYSEYESALKKSAQGDSHEMDSLIQKAAMTNGTSVEQTKKILTDLTAMADQSE